MRRALALVLLAITSCVAAPAPTTRDLLLYRGGEFTANVTPAPEEGGDDVEVRRIEFPSPVKSPHASNNTVRCLHYAPKGKRPDRAIVLLPGWKSHLILEKGFSKDLAGQGWNVLLIVLPYQEERSPAGVASDEYTVSSDLDRNESVMIQAMQDIQRATTWLRNDAKIPREKTGLLGLSLGACLGSIAYSVTDDFHAGLLGLGGGDLADVIWNSWLTAYIKRELMTRGYTLETLRLRLTTMDPLTYANPAHKKGLKLVGSKGDEIFPPDSIRHLATAFGNAPIDWIEGDHIKAVTAMILDGEEIEEYFSAALGK